MKESVLMNKSKAFALMIIRLHSFLRDQQREFVLSKQILRSGTSIGANIAEAFYAQSDADFIAKLYIARKEAGETLYWIELLQDAILISDEKAEALSIDCKELLRMLTASIKTMKAKIDS